MTQAMMSRASVFCSLLITFCVNISWTFCISAMMFSMVGSKLVSVAAWLVGVSICSADVFELPLSGRNALSTPGVNTSLASFFLGALLICSGTLELFGWACVGVPK